MSARLEVVLDIQAFRIELDTLQAAPRLFNGLLASDAIPASQQRTDASINAALGAHVRPTDWQTPKQRRWWYKLGVTLWHGRKDIQDWMVRQDGNDIVAVNPMPGARFVFLPVFQQRMHQTIWMTTDTYKSTELPPLIGDVKQAWYQAYGVNQP